MKRFKTCRRHRRTTWTCGNERRSALRTMLLVVPLAALWQMLVVEAVFTPRTREELQGDGGAEKGLFGCIGACGHQPLWKDEHLEDSETGCRLHDDHGEVISAWTSGNGVCVNADLSVPSLQGDGTYGVIGSWDVRGVQNMGSMFQHAKAFNEPFNWQVSSVTSMAFMFHGAEAFNQPLDSWDVSSVANTYGMFNTARAFNQPLNSWDVSSLTQAHGMFNEANAFNQPLDSWDVSSVTIMNSMFEQAHAFNQPLNSWQISSVRAFGNAFYGAKQFSQILCTPLWEDAASIAQLPGQIREVEMDNGEIITYEGVNPGTFAETAGAKVLCCKPGNYLLRKGTTVACAGCPPGKFQNKSKYAQATDCTSCAPGKFQEFENEKSCNNCPLGFHQENKSKPFCLPCFPGKYQDDEAQSECKACAAGRFMTGAYAKECKECSGGSFSSEGQASCTTCPAGWQMNGTLGDHDCVACSPGRVSASPGDNCTACELGKYSGQIGQSVCLTCIPGEFGNETGLQKCHECAIGRYRVNAEDKDKNNATTCDDCPQGYYQITEGQASCMPCIPGEFGNETGLSKCHMCPIGKASKNQRAISCTDCDIGESSDVAGSAKCTKCGAGTYGKAKGAPCEPCELGRYRNGSDPETKRCRACPSGQYQGSTGSAACLPCIPGLFNPRDDGASECNRCVEGQFTAETEQVSCISCPAGRGTSGQDGAASCLPCAAGKRLIDPGDAAGSACETCAPGFFSDTPNAKQCKPCRLGQDSKNGSSTCSNCETGKFGALPGECQDCPPGRFQDGKGKKECVACPINTFGTKTGAKSNGDCTSCDPFYEPNTVTGNRTGVSNATEGCICAGENLAAKEGTQARRGYFTVERLEQSAAGKLCEICPDGASCSKDGMTVASISALPGRWRPSLTSLKFPKCASALVGSADADYLATKRCCPEAICHNLTFSSADPSPQCAPGYTGVLCASCTHGYVKMGLDCVECLAGDASIGLAFVALLLGMVLPGFLGFVLFLMCGAKAESSAGRTADKVDAAAGVFGQFKILISFLQIISSMPSVMGGVPFPVSFLEFSIPLKAFNLDILSILNSILGTSQCQLALGFHGQTIVHLTLPPLAVIAIVGAYYVSKCAKKPKSAKAVSHLRAQAAKVLILVILLLYPGLATRLFQLLNCTGVEGVPGRFLVPDMSVECFVGEHAVMAAVGTVFMVLYILGIPVFMFAVLFKNRKALWDKSHPDHEEVQFEYGGLYSSYEPAYWWFECFIIVHKMFMTGALVIIAPQSSVQPLAAVLFQLTFMLSVLKLSPYESGDDDITSFVTSLSVCLATLAAMVLITSDSEMGGSSFDANFLGIFLITITVITISFETIMIFLNTAFGRRLRVRLCGGDSSSGDGNRVRVAPTLPRGGENSSSTMDNGELKSLARSWGEQ